MRQASLDFLKHIVDTPSPSGYEQPAARVYRSYTEPFADAVSTDVHGNVTAVLNPGASMRIMLAGHMDELGFIVHHIDDQGQLHFRTIGGHDSAVAIGQRLWIYGKRRIPGVIGRTAIHLQDEAERKKKPEIKDMWIDIGAASRAEAEEIVSLGDVATYQCEFQPLMGDRATARGFDNKMGTFIVAETLRLLKEDGGLDPNVGVYAVATVQEEIGLRGARTASYGIAAQTGLAVDVNHATDYPGVSKTLHGQLEVGKDRACRAGRIPTPSPSTSSLPRRARPASHTRSASALRNRHGRQRHAAQPGRHGDRAARGAAPLHAHACRTAEPEGRRGLCSADGGLLPAGEARHGLHTPVILDAVGCDDDDEQRLCALRANG